MIAGREVDLQLDKKAMPGEAGPCYMITEAGCFKGYIAKQKKGAFKQLGVQYYSSEDLQTMSSCLETYDVK